MSDVNQKEFKSGASTYLMVPILIFFILLIFAVIRGPGLISSAGIGSAIIVVAPLVLATYALTVIVMAGRAGVDLSIGPLIGFINVGLIQLVGIGFLESPIAVFLFAMGVGIAYQIVMGLIIVFVRVQPIIVSLSGYLALVGLNLIVMPRPGGLAPEWMLDWGSGTSIFSPVLAILVLATIGWYILARTAFFGNLRMMGSDERATYTSGVNINLVRLGAHAIGGIYAGLAALTFTSLISSGDPTQGTTYTLMAVTALVLGGANLAGGRGSAFGSLLGALNIYLITYALSTFNFGMVQSYVTDLAYGVMLVVSLLISIAIPEMQKRAQNLSPMMFFSILAVVALSVIMHASMDNLIDPLAASLPFIPFSPVADVVDDSYSAGTYFLFIILGVALTAYAFRMLFKYTSAPMLGLILVIIVTALGLVFNPENSIEMASTPSQTTQIVSNLNYVDFFALETIQHNKSSYFSVEAVANSTYILIAVIGVILLSSIMILTSIPTVNSQAKRRAFLSFVLTIAFIAVSALFFKDYDQAYLMSNLSGEVYAILLVGLLLFTITMPLVNTVIPNVSNVFIGGIAILAVTCVYFFSGNNSVEQTDTHYRAPIIMTDLSAPTTPKIDYSTPRRSIEPSSIRLSSELAYICFIIILFQLFIRIAMGENSFRSFWRHWHIPTFAAIAWGALFYATGVPFWKIITVIAIAIISAPNVMHIINTYLLKHTNFFGAGNKEQVQKI